MCLSVKSSSGVCNECVCVLSSPLSKLDQLVSVARTCAEGGVCERQTFTLTRVCVCFSLTPVFI